MKAMLLLRVLLVGSLLLVTGCSTVLSGRYQTVTIKTDPPGRTVMYQGTPVRDGETITVEKKFGSPQFSVEGRNVSQAVTMEYKPDAWLLGDAALLLLGIIPGVVAGGIDVASGAWRNLDAHQHVSITIPEEKSAPVSTIVAYPDASDTPPPGTKVKTSPDNLKSTAHSAAPVQTAARPVAQPAPAKPSNSAEPSLRPVEP